MNKYIIGIDQSTQGTKAVLVDQNGRILLRKDRPHRQIINGLGWVSHDPEEVYRNTLAITAELIAETGVQEEELYGVGISNQRETTVAFREDGTPVTDAIVWQCSRAKDVVAKMADENPGLVETVEEKTGIPFSPFFPAAKIKWLIENCLTNEAGEADLSAVRFGTIDSYIVYRLTEGKSFKTDYSNASRYELMNIRTLGWDAELLETFGIPQECLPKICDSNAYYGETTFGGLLKKPLPILSVMGDSHAALYAQGCHEKGMVKTTYGTGSSIMMNIGPEFRKSSCGLATSVAYAADGKVYYGLEGNINYTGAVISWLRDQLQMISSPAEVEPLARLANPDDTTILVPAFTGLSAPHWANDAKATITGMTRTTGRNELCKAALESIAYQITDILSAMEKDSGLKIGELRVDGGPTRNAYLMQFQADLADCAVSVPDMEEFSALGVSYMAGQKAGIMDGSVFESCERKLYRPQMTEAKRAEKKALWADAIRRTL